MAYGKYGAISNYTLYTQKVNWRVKNVVLNLGAYMSALLPCPVFPSLKRLSDDLGLSQAAISKHLHKAQEAGLIQIGHKWQAPYKDNNNLKCDWRSNCYTILSMDHFTLMDTSILTDEIVFRNSDGDKICQRKLGRTAYQLLLVYLSRVDLPSAPGRNQVLMSDEQARKYLGCCRQKFQKCKRELVQAGLIKVERRRNKRGLFATCVITISDRVFGTRSAAEWHQWTAAHGTGALSIDITSDTDVADSENVAFADTMCTRNNTDTGRKPQRHQQQRKLETTGMPALSESSPLPPNEAWLEYVQRSSYTGVDIPVLDFNAMDFSDFRVRVNQEPALLTYSLMCGPLSDYDGYQEDYSQDFFEEIGCALDSLIRSDNALDQNAVNVLYHSYILPGDWRQFACDLESVAQAVHSRLDLANRHAADPIHNFQRYVRACVRQMLSKRKHHTDERQQSRTDQCATWLKRAGFVI